MKIRLSALALGLIPLACEAAFPPLKLELVCENQLFAPVSMVSPLDGSGRMFISEQRGKIRIFRNGMLEPGVFLDLGAKLCSERAGYDERGLLGLAFHPGFGSPVSPGYRRFYVYYIANSPNAPGVTSDPVDSRTVVAEYQVSAANPDLADPASGRILLSFDKPQFNHAGGGLEFGPDGLLYFSVGDGGSSQDNNYGHTGGTNLKPVNAKGNALDLTKLFGKIHRIAPLGTNGPGGQYGIPADNPFATSPNGERPEIFAYGLRNTWRFSFDSRPGGTGRLFAADVGQGEVEEIDLIVKGGNFGWRNKEGTFFPSFSAGAPAMPAAAIDPIAQYAHPGVLKGSPSLPQYGVSVTGGYVYRGSGIAGLAGKYVFGDYSRNSTSPEGSLLGLEETSPGVWALSFLDILGGNPIGRFVYGFGQDQNGELFVLTAKTRSPSAPDPATGLPSGAIHKLVPVPATATLAVPLGAAKDNTIYQEADYSNGQGSWIFAGATDTSNNGSVRRSLISFNLSPIPAGATVASSTLTLKMDRTLAPAYDLSLHKVLANWGEGTSNADGPEGAGINASATDATWLKPVFGQSALWDLPGGDFAETKSATTSVGNEANYTWSSPRMAYDLNGWLATPSAHFGWLLKADIESSVKPATGSAGQSTITVTPDTEGLVDGMAVKGGGIGIEATISAGGINTATHVITLTVANSAAVNGSAYFAVPSAKRFASRNNPTTTFRPKLEVSYVPAAVPTRRRAWELAHYFIGEFIDDSRDSDLDGIADGIEYAWGFSPDLKNAMADGLVIDSSGVAGGSPATITFRRDPLAIDITYILQASSDLVTWATLAQSTGGATTTGPGYQSEADVPGQAPFKTVTATDIVSSAPNRFIRLKVTRP
jgi:glucose/arabinose dehydrogenase